LRSNVTHLFSDYLLRCEKFYLYTLDKPDVRLVMPAGNSTAWSMVSNLTAKCLGTRP